MNKAASNKQDFICALGIGLLYAIGISELDALKDIGNL